jgi:hypothetical protein
MGKEAPTNDPPPFQDGLQAGLAAPAQPLELGDNESISAVARLTAGPERGSVAQTEEASMSASGNTGPSGQPRGIGFGILMFIVTLHFYSWYWVFKTQEEIKQHTGEGLGGVLGLVIWILLNPVEAFVIPSEVGKMYEKDGRQRPMSGWTGLWLFPGGILIIPAIVWFVKVQGALNRYWEGKASAAAASAAPA